MVINLKEKDLFTCDGLDLGTKINYIYGKNGTGKSTLTKLIENQFRESHNVKVFRGFEAIVGVNKRLNAVVLGEKNTAIQEKIDSYKSAINDFEKKIDDTSELMTKYHLAKKTLADADNKVEKSESDAARAIKNEDNPKITGNYNKNNFKKDIANKKLLADEDRQKLRDILKSEIKTASPIDFPKFDIDHSVSDINEILVKKVEAKRDIARIDGNSEKQHFAEAGLRIHKPGDICAFCGNPISNEVFEELNSYFSGSEIESLRREIEDYISKLKDIKSQIQRIRIESDSFYPDYISDVKNIAIKWSESAVKYIDIIDSMLDMLEDKKKYLFESMDIMQLTDDIKPYRMRDFEYAYDELRKKNNDSDIKNRQEDAKEKLRLDAVYRQYEEIHYEKLCNDSESAKEKLNKIEENIDEIKEQIGSLYSKIGQLQSQTVSEQKLADDINKTLSVEVGFELEHYEYDNKGYYCIKDKRTGETRPVDQLSTGEKNVIAFLYFMEKLEEVEETPDQRERIIVFDDPVNSNDEKMQFLIANELKDWINVKNKNGNKDTVVVFTHNISFYLNICRFYDDEKYKENNVYHLEKISNYKTEVKKIECRREDIVSAYEEDWRQLVTIYNSPESNADSLLNPMRKIVETYTSFNKVNKYNFCNNSVHGTILLMHSNSHGIVDLDASANGHSKVELLRIFYECFAANESGKKHIERYWKGVEDLI